MDSTKRTLTIPQFCETFNVGRTTAFAELKAKRLKAVKIGRKTLIPRDAAEAWLRDLPAARQAA